MSEYVFQNLIKKPVIYNYVTIGKISTIGDAKQAFTDALNKAARTRYKAINLEFYDTVLVTTNLPETNSTIRVVLLPDKEQVADYIVSFNRVNTSDLGLVNVTVTGKSLISDVLDQVNLLTNSNITINDIVDGPLPAGDSNGKANIDLVFKPSSMLYYSGPRITLASEVTTIPGVTKASVGLSLVDNTSDINKPVSTQQAIADSNVLAQANTYTDVAISNISQGGSGDPLWASVEW